MSAEARSEDPRAGRRVWLWLAAGLPLGWAALRLAAAFPQACDRVYGRGLFPRVRNACRALASALPFSAAESLLACATLLVLALSLRGVLRVLHGRASWRGTLLLAARRAAATAGVVYLVFLLCWGFNYARPPLAERLGLDRSPPRVGELRALCQELAQRAGRERKGCAEDEGGVFRLVRPGQVDAVLVGAALRAQAARHPALAELDAGDPLLRYPWSGPLLTRLGITGIWSPFTAEAHVNGEIPDVLLPFTACHEAAHGCGVTREDEASFVAYLAGRRASSAELRYSASFCAWLAALAQLARVDLASARQLVEQAHSGLRRDADAVEAYWGAHESWVTDVGRRTNDAYLRTQGEERGVESYGELVDLLLAERRERGGEL